jgi:hypothetical protein
MRSLATLVPLALAAVAVAASADTPLRHLVYSFSYEERQHGAVPSDPGTATGVRRSFNGRLDDMGTITVYVLREAPTTPS